MLNNVLIILVAGFILGALFLSLTSWSILLVRWFQGYPFIERKYHSDVIPISKFALALTMIWLGISLYSIVSSWLGISLSDILPALFEREANVKPAEPIDVLDRISVAVQFAIVSGGILIGLFFAGFFVETGDRVSLSRLGFRWNEPWLQIVTGAIGVFVALIPVYISRFSLYWVYTEESMHPFLRLLKERGLGIEMAWIAVAAVIIAPLMEELMFRVILQSSIIRGLKAMGMEQDAPPLGIILASVVFAFVHGFPNMVAIFPLSLVLGTIYHYRRSYLSVVTMHALFNGMNLIMVLVISKIDLPEAMLSFGMFSS